ncbi:hypothetical protein LRS74_18750 [Streptomyces sp. LX-29]|uniref:hypothetical protein n=1 Tax=Streptomyces sp. LX-29 TaxID=2900152 RepID=UPI00240E5E9A|nr:hypothetical protein [Streptomyces sp. LX-29]WFB08854.1 hypothetical protein LRS74_18750 [Streptomyces sp. LX-29]
MSTAAFSPLPGAPTSGATALRPETEAHHRHVLGNALHAVRVFATAAFGVTVLGEYGDDLVKRRN